MVSTTALGCGVACAPAKIVKRQELRRLLAGWQAGRQDLGDVVGTRKRLQMPRQRRHVSCLNGHRVSQLILQGEIAAHGVRSLVVVLDSTQRQPGCENLKWTEWVA